MNLNKSDLISIEEDQGLRIESFAVVKSRGVSTKIYIKLNRIIQFTVYTKAVLGPVYISPVWWEAHLSGMNYFCVRIDCSYPTSVARNNVK